MTHSLAGTTDVFSSQEFFLARNAPLAAMG
jgi:hypothetical protein